MATTIDAESTVQRTHKKIKYTDKERVAVAVLSSERIGLRKKRKIQEPN